MVTFPLPEIRGVQRPIYQGEPPDPWHDRGVRERALKTALFAVTFSARHFERHRRSMDDWFWDWANKPARIRNEGVRRSNVPSGRESETVDTMVSEMMTAMRKSKTLIAAIPNEMADDSAANAAERLQQYRLANLTSDMGWWPVFDQMCTNATLFGGAPAKAKWEVRTFQLPIYPEGGGAPRFVEHVGYQGPTMEAVFVFDYFPHPNKRFAGDHYPQAHLTWENFSDLKSLEKDGSIYEDVDRIPDLRDMGQFLGSGMEGGDKIANAIMGTLGDMNKRSEQREQLGWTSDSRMLPDGVLTIECECMFRPEVDYVDSAGRKRKGSEPVRAIITVANGHVIRVAPTPIPTQDSIWLFAKMNHIPGQLFGMSYIQKAKPMAHVEKVLLNMTLTGIAQNLNRPKIVRRDLLEGGAQSLDDRPGGIIKAKHGADINQVMREIQLSPVGTEVTNMMQYVWGRFQGITGLTDVFMGRVPTGEQTATETNRAFAQVSKRFLYAFVWFGATFVGPWAKLSWKMDQAFLPLPHRFQILGESAGRNFRAVIGPEEMAMQPDFLFMGPDRSEVDSVRLMQLQDLFKISTSFQDFPWGQNLIKDLFIKIAENYDVMDLERLKERIEYELPPSLSMTLQAQLAAGQGGGGMNLGGGQILGQMPSGAGRADRRITSGGSNSTTLAKAIGGALSQVKAA